MIIKRTTTLKRLLICLTLLFIILSSTTFAASLQAQLLTPESGWTRYFDTNENFTYNGTWTANNEPYPANGTLHNSKEEGSSLNFKFTGSKLRIISPTYSTYPEVIQVYIDGTLNGTFNPRGNPLYTVLQYEATGLTEGTHTCKIVINEGHSSHIEPGAWALEAIDLDENGQLLPYTPLTIEVLPSNQTVNIGDTFTTNITLNKVSEICAEDLKFTYDHTRFEFVGYEDMSGIKVVKNVTNPSEGTIRLLIASLGKDNLVNNSKTIVKLKFKAIGMGQGKIDSVSGRIASIESEWDIDESECGEAFVTVIGLDDVNKTGEFSLIDLAIDAYYYNDFASVDTNIYNTDIVVDNAINDDDLTKIAENILNNANYIPNL